MIKDPVKCSLILDDPKKPQETHYEMEYESGDVVSANELDPVDIGRDAWPYKIPASTNPITWKFVNRSNDILAYHQRKAINVAFRTIGWLIPRRYRYIHDQTRHTFFTHRFTHNLSVFNDRVNILAQAYLFQPRSTKNGVIEWNDNHFFTPFGDTLPAYLVDPDHFTEGERWASGDLKTLATQPFLEINMHEIKHGHGYYHDENSRESLMYPMVKPGYIRIIGSEETKWRVNSGAFIWTDDDIQRWQDGYGKRFFNHLHLFRARRLRGRFVEGVPYRIAI